VAAHGKKKPVVKKVQGEEEEEEERPNEGWPFDNVSAIELKGC
jgi:hypothetical protein